MIRYLSTILLGAVLVSAMAMPAVAAPPKKPATVTLTDEQRELFEETLTRDEARQLADEYLESLLPIQDQSFAQALSLAC